MKELRHVGGGMLAIYSNQPGDMNMREIGRFDGEFRDRDQVIDNWNRVQFEHRVADWMQACFGPVVSADRLERNDRFIEEALELVQACEYTRDRAHALVDYVFDRPVGDRGQEVGGVMVTLAALCRAQHLHMAIEGEAEITRIEHPSVMEKIRKKQAMKPTGSALPGASDG